MRVRVCEFHHMLWRANFTVLAGMKVLDEGNDSLYFLKSQIEIQVKAMEVGTCLRHLKDVGLGVWGLTMRITV